MASAFSNLGPQNSEMDPKVHGKGEEAWVDVTEEMKGLAANMKPGEMVMASKYTLHDSMSALELMSPKMDPGMQYQGYVSVEERHKSGELIIPPPSVNHIVSIMDHMLKLEMSWYSGHSLICTVYTCVFTNEYAVKEIEAAAGPILSGSHSGDPSDSSLLAFIIYTLCAGTCQLCNMIHQLIRTADVYEEEDYAAYFGGLDLDPFGNLGMEKLLELFDLAENLLTSRKENQRNNDAFPEAGCDTLLSILRMRRKYLQMHAYFDEAGLKGLNRALPLINELFDLFKIAGPNRDASEADVNSNEYFDPLLCQKLLGPSPPRALDIMNKADAHNLFISVLEDLIVVCNFMDCENLVEVYRYMKMFSERNANIIPRSRIVGLLYTADSHKLLGKYSYPNAIVQNMREAGIPDTTTSHELCKEFVDSALVRAIYDIFRVCTANRARKRRKIVHLLKTWRDIQHSADYLDHQIFLNSNEKEFVFNPIGSWTVEWTGRLMNEFLILGFDLDLYALHEVDVTLWTIECILKGVSENRRRMDVYAKNQLENEIAELLSQVSVSAKNKTMKKEIKEKKKKLNRLKSEGNRPPISQATHDENYDNEVCRNLSSGILCLLIALRCEGKLKDPQLSFGFNAVRYEHRMKPLQALRPEVLEYEVFESVCRTSKYQAAELYANANRKFVKTKEWVSQLIKRDLPDSLLKQEYNKKLLGIARVAVSNSLTIQSAKKMPKDQQVKVYLDYSTNAGFPIIKLK